MEKKKYQIDTTLETLIQLKKVFRKLKLDKFMSEGLSGQDILGALTSVLAEEGLLNEVCQIVTKSETDFNTRPIGESLQVIDDFVRDFFAQIPASWKTKLTAAMGIVSELGKSMLSRRESNGSTPTTKSNDYPIAEEE